MLLFKILARVWALCLCLSFATLHAEPALEDYGALPAVSMMAVSPNGQAVAFRKTSSKLDAVTVVSLVTGEMLGGFDISNLKLRALYFFDDQRVILRTAQQKWMPGYRDNNFDVSTAFVLDLKTNRIEQLLTPGDKIIVGQTGLGSIAGALSDRSHVFMPAFAEKKKLNRREEPRYSLMKVDIDSPNNPRIAVFGHEDSRDFFIDDQGHLLAEERFDQRTGKHSLVVERDGKDMEIFSQTVNFPRTNFVGLSVDGQALVISDEDGGRTVLRTLSLADGTLSDPIFGRADADVGEVLTDIHGVVQGVQYSGLRPNYEFFDSELTRRVEEVQAQYPGHSVWLTSWSPDWQHLVVSIEGNGSSGDYMLHSKGHDGRFLASARPDIGAEQVNPVVSFRYPARDGMSIPALMTIPLSRADSLSQLPAIVLPHGGPAAHDWQGFDWEAQALASRGYLVLQPQFRGSTGFGIEHWSAGRGQWGQAMQNDLTDGIQALIKQNIVDPERVCIIGSSYGGYAALAGGAFTPELYQCVVSINGVSDLPAMLSAIRSEQGKYHWSLAYWEDSMVAGDTSAQSLQAVSPAYFADRFQAPVLLLHGEDDEVVRFEQSQFMANALEKAGKPVRLVKLADEDHYLSNSGTRMSTLKAVLDFVEQHIGTQAAN